MRDLAIDPRTVEPRVHRRVLCAGRRAIRSAYKSHRRFVCVSGVRTSIGHDLIAIGICMAARRRRCGRFFFAPLRYHCMLARIQNGINAGDEF